MRLATWIILIGAVLALALVWSAWSYSLTPPGRAWLDVESQTAEQLDRMRATDVSEIALDEHLLQRQDEAADYRQSHRHWQLTATGFILLAAGGSWVIVGRFASPAKP